MLLTDLPHTNNNVDSDTLIIGLHGLDGTGLQHMTDTGLDTITNATVVCPDSPTVNTDGKNQWRTITTNDDIFWLMGLIQYMITHYGIDPTKVHINGQSNGGVISYMLADIFPNTFESVTVTSTFFPLVTSNISTRVVHIHGDEDLITPIDGILANTLPKVKAGGAPLLFINVIGAGHSIQTSIDGFPTLNEKLGVFGSSVLNHIKSNTGL